MPNLFALQNSKIGGNIICVNDYIDELQSDDSENKYDKVKLCENDWPERNRKGSFITIIIWGIPECLRCSRKERGKYW